MEDTLRQAVSIARRAGAVALRHFNSRDLTVDRKYDGTVVTKADRETEELLRREFADAFPDDTILGEEYGESEIGGSGRRWILDPIDGTFPYSRGVPTFGTLIGLEVDGEAVLGVVEMPAVGETVYAARGCGAWWTRHPDADPEPARVSETDRIEDALFTFTNSRRFDTTGGRPGLTALQEKAKNQRGWGDCFGHMLVATGRSEIMLDPKLAIWDCAAIVPILLEAGGDVFDRRGRHSHAGTYGMFSTNAKLAPLVRELFVNLPDVDDPEA